MSVELWLGQEFATTHEMKALSQFLERIVTLYEGDDDLFLVLTNFLCQGEQLDLAVVKRNGIMVVELKEVGGPVTGRENGPWTGKNPDGSRWQINDGRRRNPFEQVRDYRNALMGQLRHDASQFLTGQKASQTRLDHVAAIVALCPQKPPDSDIQITDLKWFSVVGLDELPQEIYYQRSSSINLSKADLHGLAQLWRLRRCPVERIVPSLAPAHSALAAMPAAAEPALAPVVTRQRGRGRTEPLNRGLICPLHLPLRLPAASSANMLPRPARSHTSRAW